MRIVAAIQEPEERSSRYSDAAQVLLDGDTHAQAHHEIPALRKLGLPRDVYGPDVLPALSFACTRTLARLGL